MGFKVLGFWGLRFLVFLAQGLGARALCSIGPGPLQGGGDKGGDMCGILRRCTVLPHVVVLVQVSRMDLAVKFPLLICKDRKKTFFQGQRAS